MKQKYLLKFCTIAFMFMLPLGLMAQTIKGKVTDSSSQGLPFMNVLVKGTSNGTTTDDKGEFSITVKELPVNLVVSSIGFKTKVINVSSSSYITITIQDGNESLEEIVVIGSRNAKRTAVDTPVPVDIIDVQDLATKNGKVEVNDILQFAAPSFNATKQSGSDGADHIVPASLRGLGPDQTLVLINGKRRHQSSLVNIFGTRGRGNSGTDLNAIPASAING